MQKIHSKDKYKDRNSFKIIKLPGIKKLYYFLKGKNRCDVLINKSNVNGKIYLFCFL